MTDHVRRVLVVVVTHQSAQVVQECLRSIPAAVSDGPEATTVVVDNASTDETLALVEEVAPDVEKLSLSTNDGYAAAINAAMARFMTAETDAVMVLNPDVRLEAGSIASLLEALEVPGVGIAVPLLTHESGSLQPSLRREPTVLRALGEAVLGGDLAGRFPILGEVVVDPESYSRPNRVAWATGAAMLISSECLRSVGAWDESYFLYSEETDYCLRAKDRGFAVMFWPDAAAVHIGGESNSSPRLWSILTRNRIRQFRSRHGILRSMAFGAAVLLNECIRAALGRSTNREALGDLVSGDRDVRASGLEPDGYVCFSAQDWWYFSRGHSDFQLMTRIAEREPVVFVNSLGMRMPRPGTTSTPWGRIGRKLRSMGRGLRSPLVDVPGFHVLTPFFLPIYGEGLLAAANRWLIQVQVRRAMSRAGMSRPAVVVTLPTAWPIARRLERARTIVYRSDRYSALPEADTSLIAALEREMLQDADLTLFASSALLEEEGPKTPSPVLLRHGVDLEAFRPADELTVSDRLDQIGQPRAGFVGMIDAYTVDVGLLDELARSYPDVQFVLAGQVEVDIEELCSRANVHHLGVLPFEEVPSVLAGLDVLLMPWQRNEWIRHCNPIKLKEYLAVGRPVLSTDFPEARNYESVIRIAERPSDFVDALGELIAGNSASTPALRRAAVASETWATQVDTMMDLVDAPPSRTVADSSGSCAAS